MDIYAITIAISLLLYLGIGQYAGRRVKHLEDYFVVGRNAPTLFYRWYLSCECLKY